MEVYNYLRSISHFCTAITIIFVALTKTQLFHFSLISLLVTAVKANIVPQPHFVYRELEPKYKLLQGSVQLETKCSPKLELLNCGADTRNMPKYSPYQSAMILSNVEVDAGCKDLERVSMKWKVWLVGNNEKFKERVRTFVDKQNYFVEQRSLNYGTYKVKLHSSVVYSNEILSVDAFCYFEMVRLPVQTVISGGLKRHKFYKSPTHFEIFTLVIPDACESNQRTGKLQQLNTLYEWRCDSEVYFCSAFKTTKTFREVTGPFVAFKDYNFTLKVQTLEEEFGHTERALSEQPEFQVIKMDNISQLELTITCFMNCGGSVFKSNPQEIVYLEANLNNDFEENNKGIVYYWNYTIVDSTKKLEDIAEMREHRTAKNVLVVKRNKLTENQKYIFSVSLGQFSPYAELVVETCSLPKSPKCTISPVAGVRGETYFNIDCSVSKQEDAFLSVSFEFFDRYANEDLGRYLGLSTTGILKRVVLTRDRLIVRAINIFGAYNEAVISLQLSPFRENRSNSNLNPGNHILGNYIERIGLITAYSDYLNSSTFSLSQANLLLAMLKDEEMCIEEITGATLLINALHNVLCASCNKIKYLESKTTRSIAQVAHHASHITREMLTNPLTSSRYVTTTRILELANSIIRSFSNLLSIISNRNYNLLDSYTQRDLEIGAFYIMESLDNILTAVAFKVLIAVNHIDLSSKYIEVILLNIGSKLEGVDFSSGMLQTPLNLTKNCLKKIPEFQTQIVTFKKVPFWWGCRPGGEINTHIIDMKHKHGIDFILTDETSKEKYKIDLDVVVDFEPLTIYSSVKQPNPKDSPDVNDFIVAVHRIAPAVHSKSFVKFVGIEDNTTLKAVLLQDQRPDYDYMNSNAKILTNKSSSLCLTVTESNNDLFLYLGILPGDHVKFGDAINYTFEIFTASCKVRRYETWMVGSKCTVTDRTNKEQVSCACSVFTVILGGQIYVPLHDLNPFSDIPLLISASDYPFVIIIVAIVIISYIFMLFWTIRKDKRNKKKVNLIVLEDNDARDTFGYLVGVFTGSRIRAGTTSRVGIMLLGEEGMSRSHILESELRPTLQANSDDWFLIYTRHHLGSITNIIVWMDYSGSRPHWYCSKIFLCDLHKYDTDIFYVESWFGIKIQEIHFKMVKECATYKEINNINRILSENVENGFRENHLWLSIFIRHPRSLVCSSHRLTVAFCSLFATIGVSVLIYYLTTPQTEDIAYYGISKETFVNGIVSGLVGSLFSFITLHLFKASYKFVPCASDCHEHLETTTMYHLERQRSILVEDPSWLQKLKKIIRYAKPCQVMPVQTSEDNMVGIKINRRRIVFAIFLCFVVSVLNIHLTVICGIHFEEIKSLLWFTSLVIGMIQTICVTQPITILANSLMLVVSKTRYLPLKSHIIEMNQLKRGSLKRNRHEDFSEHLTTRNTLLRSHRPITSRETELEQKQVRIVVMWTSLYIFGCLLFLAIVSWLITQFHLGVYCIINGAVCREIDTQESCQFSHYSSYNDFKQFLDMIQERILPVLYSRNWYNGASKTLKTESFPATGWLGDESSRLVGPPRLRQIRVKNISYCHTPYLLIDNSFRCFMPLDDETEETGNYSTGWVVDDWVDCQFDQASWRYSDAEQAKGTLIRTPSGYICHGGGYISSLTRSEDEAKLIIRNIIDTDWIDKYTRVLMLEFTMYNVNKDVFTTVTIYAEITPYATVVANQYVQSIRFSNPQLSGIIFLAYFFVFTLRVLILINVEGVGNFFRNIWNFQEIIIIVWYLVSAVYYCYILIQEEKYRGDIQKQGKDVFFHVQILTSEVSVMRNIISVLFCLVAFRMLRIIHFNADVRQYLQDLYAATQGIIWIWLVVSLFVFVQWRFVMFLVVPPPGDSFKDLLVYQSDFKRVIYKYQDLHGKILAFMISLFTQIGMFSYVCSLTHYYRKGQLKRKPLRAVDANKTKQSRYSRLWESSFVTVPQ